MTRWPCAEAPRAWGSGKYPADRAVAVSGCGRCPRDHDECLAEFARVVHPNDTDGLVVAGLHGRDLRAAMQRARDANRQERTAS